MPVNSFDNYPMSWKPLRSELEKPYYLSIASKLEQDISAGRLPENTKLPPQRELADFLDLNLSTITRAYKLCELKGLLYAVTGSGTFVSPGISSEKTFVDRNDHVIEMGIIKPFYECNQSIVNASQKVLNRPQVSSLFEYSDPFGTSRQQSAALQWLEILGIPAQPENLLLTAGAQNALSVVLISLFGAGDKIAVDHFTYTNFKGLANFLHIQLISIDSDSFGMSPDDLARICRQTDIKGIYLMPTCSNPTGIFMPAHRRRQLSEIIRKYNLLLIEDDIYSFLAPTDVRPFFTMLPEHTVHISSISKSLCAGLRLAFLIFPEKYRERLIAGMLNINLKTVSLNAEIIAELIISKEAERIVREKIRLAERRNEIFQSIFPTDYTDHIERFFHWLRLPATLSSEEAELEAMRQGVHILGSHRFALQSKEKSSYIRLSVTSPDTEESLRTGLQILKTIFEKERVEFFV